MFYSDKCLRMQFVALTRVAHQRYPVPERFRFNGQFSRDIASQITSRLLSHADRPPSDLLRPTTSWPLGYWTRYAAKK
jgi:hypothetical protein